MKLVPIGSRNGVVGHAMVDDDDFALVSQHRWHLVRGYAGAGLSRRRDSQSTITMHRLVMGLTFGDGKAVDHINRNKLDNRRANLRLATDAQNLQNQPGRVGAASSYRGVFPSKRRWRARVGMNGRQVNLGSYASELEAARVAARWRMANMPFTTEDPALLALDEQAAA